MASLLYLGEKTIDLGDPLNMWKAFAEIGRLLEDEEGYDELQSVPGFAEQEVTEWWLGQAKEQARHFLHSHADEMSEETREVVLSLLESEEVVKESWDDTKHPRADDGKFGSGSGTSEKSDKGDSKKAKSDWQARDNHRSTRRSEASKMASLVKSPETHAALDKATASLRSLSNGDAPTEQVKTRIQSAIQTHEALSRSVASSLEKLSGSEAHAGKLTRSLEKTLAKVTRDGAKAATRAEKGEAARAALAEHQKKEPVEPDQPEAEEGPEYDAWESAHEKWEEKQAKWEEKAEKLQDTIQSAADDVSELVDGIEDALNDHLGTLESLVDDAEVSVHTEADKEEASDPEPEEPEEPEEEPEDP